MRCRPFVGDLGPVRAGMSVAHRCKFMALLSLSFLAVSCGGPSANSDERVVRLSQELEQTQAELQAAKKNLTAAQSEVAKLKSSAPSSSLSVGSAAPPVPAAPSAAAAVPSREVLEDAYTTAAKALKKQVQDKLKDFTVETCTLHNINMAQLDFPITSSISLALRAREGGVPYQLEFPVKADSRGKWIFPDTAEIVAMIEAAKQSVAAAPPAPAASADRRGAQNKSGQTPPPKQIPGVAQPVAGGAAQPPGSAPVSANVNGTYVIQWPGAGGSAGAGNRGATAGADTAGGAPAGATAPNSPPDPAGNRPPPAGQMPKTSGAMKSDRDVLIQF